MVQSKEGEAVFKDHSSVLITFALLLIIGTILADIDFTGESDKSSKVSKNTLLTGASVAVLFVVWRVFL